jgi:hypothetical protein
MTAQVVDGIAVTRQVREDVAKGSLPAWRRC